HSYTFTDISAGFFGKAQNAFVKHSDRLIYRVFDLEQETEAQDFEVNSYNLTIAANVLHTTKSLEKSLQRVRRLLKPGGSVSKTAGLGARWSTELCGRDFCGYRLQWI
ncbi:class I SAM-dependent methyltransferase, partial [Aspergillus ruber CBS 135680]